MKGQVLAVGYYGCQNLGDDTMLCALRDALSEHGVVVSATSGDPEATQRTLGIYAVPRKDFRAIRSQLAASDALVFGGGSIFQDSTSVRSCLYYWMVARLAKRLKKPLLFLGQGVGPLRSPVARWLTRNAYQRAQVTAVRDAASGDLLRELGVRKPIHLTADLALLSKVPEGGNRHGVGIAARPHGADVPALVQALSERLVNSKRLAFDLVHDHQFQCPGDPQPSTPNELIGEISGCEAMIAMRLHAGILAAHCGVPTVMLSYDPKVAAFAARAKLVCLESTSQWTPDGIVAALETALARGIDAQSVEAMRIDARRNIDLLLPCLASPCLDS